MRKTTDNLLFRLILSGTNPRQLVGFALSSFVGAFIMLFAFHSFRAVEAHMKLEDGVFGNKFMVLTKQVTGMTTLASAFGEKDGFTKKELGELSAQKGVVGCYPFVTSHFNASGNMSFKGMSLSTELFFEAVPDKCLDISVENWHAGIDDDLVPVIIPRAFLDLYNFGFASAKDMPMISEGIIKRLHFNLIISDGDKEHKYHARVLGFSDRLNTILVPMDFLVAANEKFVGSATKSAPITRVMIEADVAADSGLLTYFSSKGYQIEKDQEESYKTLSFLRGALVCVALLGLLITALAFYLLLISIRLLLEKNRKETTTLRKLGFPKSKVLGPYLLTSAVFDIGSWLAALGCLVLSFNRLSEFMSGSGIDVNNPSYWSTAALALIMGLSFGAMHHLIIHKSIK